MAANILQPPVTADLTSCDREPIHAPGSIQPHGMMLLVDGDDLHVRQVAGDVERRLGIVDWQDQALETLIGPPLSAKVAAVSALGATGGLMGRLTTAVGDVLDVSAHASGPHIIVELEAASAESMPAALVLDWLATATAGFEQAASLTSLCERAAIAFRRLTGFDRVMVYRFLDDDAGRVLAEDKREDLRSFLNQHFPASDIPRQARALYLRNLIRVIPDVAYQPVPLRPSLALPVALDMSDCSLRSVSPIHLQYLANMGVTASASVSIVTDGVLWGLIACHNETPRALTYEVRAACRSLAGSLARQIRAKEEADGYRQRLRLRGFEDDIVALLTREGPLDEVLAGHHLGEISRMMNADGVAVLRGADLVAGGVRPDDGDIQDLVAWLRTRTDEPVFATDQLSQAYPPAAEFQRLGSGVLVITLPGDEPWLLLWFRVDQLETVNWAGHPHKTGLSDPLTPLTPRASFDAWQETVKGLARAWTLPERDAATRLRTALIDVQQNRRMRELNRQLTKIVDDKEVLLQQKEFLIGEVNHRVQNSLQIVSSFLALQASASEDPGLHAALEEARRRMTAVALVHRRLYRGDQIEIVDAARYIEELCADTFSFMGPDWAKHLTLDLAPVVISTDRAVTLGLILTELMINSNKYAYGGAVGPIEIALAEDHTDLRLIVADKGGGKVSFRKGFGSRIMAALVAQLKGEIIYVDNRPGLRSTVRVPVQSIRRPA
jgi:two-component system, chemotaxis family, sensor kinase Cph1